MDSAKQGFIYFSLGTNVHSHLLTEDKIKVILDTLKELPYKVLWKYASDDLPEIPRNVRIINWVPQQDVLSKLLLIENVNAEQRVPVRMQCVNIISTWQKWTL